MHTFLWVALALCALAIGFVCGVLVGGDSNDPINYRNRQKPRP